MVDFLLSILALCREFDGSVTSWVRSNRHNNRVGGHPKSWHLDGLAVDVLLDDMSLADQFEEKVERLGYKALVESTHIHCQIC